MIDVQNRIERLEQSLQAVAADNGKLRKTLWVAGMSWMALVLFIVGCDREEQQTPQKVVIAQEFRLVDPSGKLMGIWTAHNIVGSPQRPSLYLYDENTRVRAQLAVGVRGVYLAFYDTNHRLRTQLTSDPETSILGLYDGNETLKSQIRADFDPRNLVPATPATQGQFRNPEAIPSPPPSQIR